MNIETKGRMGKRRSTRTLTAAPLLALVALGAACSSNGDMPQSSGSGGGSPSTGDPDASSTTGGATSSTGTAAQGGGFVIDGGAPSATDAGAPTGAEAGVPTAIDAALPSGDAGILPACALPAFALCSDGQIVAIDDAANQAEVALARQVLQQGVPAPADAFAQRMISDHQLSLQQSAALGIQPVENGNSREITEQGLQQMQALASETGESLARDYIDHEVVDHAMVLATIDHLLLPSANDPRLLMKLQADRAVVAEHLGLALQAEQAIEGACGGARAAADAACDSSQAADAGSLDAGSADAASGVVADAASAAAADATLGPSDAGGAFCDTPLFDLCSDAQVAAIINAASQAEVDLSRRLLAREIGGPVAPFAQQMVTDNSTLLQATGQVTQALGIMPIENGISSEIAHEADLETAKLGGESGNQRLVDFVNHEVLGHLTTLGILERILIPSAKTPELRAALVNARAASAGGLTRVLDLQATVEGGRCGGPPTVADGGPAVSPDAGAPEGGTTGGTTGAMSGGTTGGSTGGATGG